MISVAQLAFTDKEMKVLLSLANAGALTMFAMSFRDGAKFAEFDEATSQLNDLLGNMFEATTPSEIVKLVEKLDHALTAMEKGGA